MARPTKLTEELRDRIVKAVRAGNYAEAAARSCGIAPSTYYRWLQRGSLETTGVYHDFADAIHRAEGEAEVHAVAILRRAMGEDWRAALAYLERRHPGGWRRHQTTEVLRSDADRHETLDLSRLSDKELELLEQLRARATEQA